MRFSQKDLREHQSFKEISDIIGCSPDTISKFIIIGFDTGKTTLKTVQTWHKHE